MRGGSLLIALSGFQRRLQLRRRLGKPGSVLLERFGHDVFCIRLAIQRKQRLDAQRCHAQAIDAEGLGEGYDNTSATAAVGPASVFFCNAASASPPPRILMSLWIGNIAAM